MSSPSVRHRQAQVPASLHGEGRFLLRRADFEPAYLKCYHSGQLGEKARESLELLRSCSVCPRHCQVNRLEDKRALCQIGRQAWVASAFPHLGEEDCLRGWRGSGTIFFAGCNLGCVFCQNYAISHARDGVAVSPDELAGMMVQLQAAGCHNINLVTPEHVVPQILEALPRAVAGGLRLPLVYNTSGYDSPESMRLLNGVVDVYMPDFKLWHAPQCGTYLLARDYPECARHAIQAMHDQVGVLKVDEDGLALRGLLVRHLVMPGLHQDTVEIMRWLARTISPDTFVNIMDQYQPAGKARTHRRYAKINRPITEKEFEEALQAVRSTGLWRLDTRWRGVGLTADRC